VTELDGLRVDVTNSGNPLEPAFDLRSGAVRVTGTVTFDTPKDKAFALGLMAATGDLTVYSFSLEHHETGGTTMESFQGVLEGIDAAEYRLVPGGGPATYDVTVSQRD